MNFTHHIDQRVTLDCNVLTEEYKKNKNLLQKLTVKYQQLRLLDNTNGFNVPTLSELSMKRQVQKMLNNRIAHSADLNVQTKFKSILGGYQSLNERSYILLVDVSKDRKQREDQMEIDGGNLDDDNIEREWHQLTVLTSIPIQEEEGKVIIKQAMQICYKDFIERHKDIQAHFPNGEQNIEKIMTNIEVNYLKAEITSGKSGDLTKDQVIKLKSDIEQIMKDIPSVALSQMVKSWHHFRLEESGAWCTMGNEKYTVDSSILSDDIHPETNVQMGRVTKNLEKLELYVANVALYLDGFIQNNSHEVELVLSYNLEIAVKLGKALLIDSKIESKKLLKNLEETIFYKLPVLDKCILSEAHKQGTDVNNGKIIVRNMVTDQDEWLEPRYCVRGNIMDIPLQSLFMALLCYRNIMERYFYLPSNQEQIQKAICTLELINFEYVHLNSVKDERQETQSAFEVKFLATKSQDLLRQARIKALKTILDYIKTNNTQRMFFDKNGNRDIYEKLKQDEKLMRFHTTIHYFISQHIPLPKKEDPMKPKINSAQVGKSCLKQTQFDKAIEESKDQSAVDYFEVAKVKKKQGVSLQEQYNTKPQEQEKPDAKMATEEDEEGKESTNGSPPKKDFETPANQLNGTGDVDFEPAFQNAGRFRKRQTKATDIFEGVDGFKMAGNNKKMEIKLPQRSEDFSFIKKNKVKFNCVDIVINEYQQDPEELEAQIKFSKQYLT